MSDLRPDLVDLVFLDLVTSRSYLLSDMLEFRSHLLSHLSDQAFHFYNLRFNFGNLATMAKHNIVVFSFSVPMLMLGSILVFAMDEFMPARQAMFGHYCGRSVLCYILDWASLLHVHLYYGIQHVHLYYGFGT